MEENCNLCGCDKFELVKSELRDSKSKFKIFRCRGCSHVQLMPKPEEDENKEFYDKNLQDKNRGKGIDYKKLCANNLYDTRRYVRIVQELCHDVNCKILDIGAGYGFFVNDLYNVGYKNIIGIEISDERRKLALEYGTVPVVDYDINNPDRDIGKFDVITLFHVLEHLSNPIKFLKKLKTFLSPGGLLICETPNVGELLIKECSPYNDFYWIRAHLNYFSDKTLTDCFRQAGFEKVEICFEQRYGLLNLCNWLTTGKPQIERPVFEINDVYKPVEKFYRNYLEESGISDAIVAVARV